LQTRHTNESVKKLRNELHSTLTYGTRLATKHRRQPVGQHFWVTAKGFLFQHVKALY